MPQTYYYPDGTKGSKEPNDGEIFNLFVHGRFESEWMWDGLYQKWIKRAQVGLTSSGQPIIHMTKRDDVEIDDEIRQLYNYKEPEHKCECGAEKIGSNRHSSWCAKHT